MAAWVVLPQLSLGFFSAFLWLFVTGNAVIDVTVRKMVTNIAPLHTFQIKKKLSKYMQPILKYSKNNMLFFFNGSKSHATAKLAYVINQWPNPFGPISGYWQSQQ